jgi:hypothetical protein
MKALIEFYLACNIRTQFKIIMSFLGLPATIYHEISHLVMLLIFFNRIDDIKCNEFYKVEGDSLTTYSFQIIFSSRNKTNLIIVSLAPIIGIVISPLVSWYLFIYLVLAYNRSTLSKQDFNNINGSIANKNVIALIEFFL